MLALALAMALSGLFFLSLILFPVSGSEGSGDEPSEPWSPLAPANSPMAGPDAPPLVGF